MSIKQLRLLSVNLLSSQNVYLTWVPCGSGAFSLEEGRIAPLSLPRHVIRDDYLEFLEK